MEMKKRNIMPAWPEKETEEGRKDGKYHTRSSITADPRGWRF